MVLLQIAVGSFMLVAAASAYEVGTGIYDATGPSVEIPLMGYGVEKQKGEGIHFRLRARAFIVSENSKHLHGRRARGPSAIGRVAFVSIDGGMGSDIVVDRAVTKIAAQLGSGIYTHQNLCVSGTHTHSGPGGFLQYVLVQTTTLGFVNETVEAMAGGIAEAVIMAHKRLKPGRVLLGQGDIADSNINRSPTSYLRNPSDERAAYASEGDTDKSMLLLRFEGDDGSKLGTLNWFAVHGTSMNNTNKLVSGDNRGYASYLFEKAMNGPNSTAGMGPFVAAFASTNLGDVSPNIAGPRCLDTGLPCDSKTSTCNGRNEKCVAFGPGRNGDNFESTEIIGRRQYDRAQEIFDTANTVLQGSISSRHSFLRMRDRTVSFSNNQSVKLCGAALGYAFAAGTTDGPGQFDFTHGQNSTNPFWELVRGALSPPTEYEKACQAPKPILLNMQDQSIPYHWEPPVLPIQIFRIGQLFILAPPAEFTTMSGRRLRNAVRQIVEKSGIAEGEDVFVTIAGLSNSYSHYVTTFEEYQAQRYEAGSTLFGPHTLDAYIQEFSRLAHDMMAGRPSTTDAPPPDRSDDQITFLPPVVFDLTPLARKFGDVVEDAKGPYVAGQHAAVVKFQSANPRNNLHTQGTYLTVDRKAGNSWVTVATDGDWETKFRWEKDGVDVKLNAKSYATVEWDIPSSTPSGTYRICHFGDAKHISGDVKPFKGCSSAFDVVKEDIHI